MQKGMRNTKLFVYIFYLLFCIPLVLLSVTTSEGNENPLGKSLNDTNAPTNFVGPSSSTWNDGNENCCVNAQIYTVQQDSILPDLSGQWLSLTQTCKTTKKGLKCKVKGKLNIMNTGDQDAQSSVVRFYLSSDDTYYEEEIYLKQISTGKVKSGKSKTKTFSYTFPYNEPPSGKHVIAIIDADNVVMESDEVNNNIASGPLPSDGINTNLLPVNVGMSKDTYEIRSMKTFNNKLYIGTRNFQGGELYEYDGMTWKKIIIPGLSSSTTAIECMEVFNNNLYIGTENTLYPSTGTQVFRYDGATWQSVAIPNSLSSLAQINSLAVYNNHLYIGAGNLNAQLWRYDGANWTQENVSPDFWNGYTVNSMAVYNGELYIGTPCGYPVRYPIWKFDGETWSDIELPDEMIPSSNDCYLVTHSLTVYNDNLYLAIWDSGLWMYNGSSFSWINTPGDIPNYYTITRIGIRNDKLYIGANGGQVWEFNGTSWEKIGFDDSCIYTVTYMYEYNGSLYIGVNTNAEPKDPNNRCNKMSKLWKLL